MQPVILYIYIYHRRFQHSPLAPAAPAPAPAGVGAPAGCRVVRASGGRGAEGEGDVADEEVGHLRRAAIRRNMTRYDEIRRNKTR